MSHKIAENLQNMCKEILQLEGSAPNAQLIAKIEYVYEQALLLHFIEEREKRSKAIGARVDAQLQEIFKEKNVSSPASESKAASPTTYMSEVKILPHPEGPPKPNKQEEAILEEARELQQNEQDHMSFKTNEPLFSEEIESLEEETIEEPEEVTPTPAAPKSASKSINAKYATLNIGLNDRIAFVKHLFAGSAEDYNRVLSQLNTMDDLSEMELFIAEMVKPEYDWNDKEEYEERFMAIVRARFN